MRKSNTINKKYFLATLCQLFEKCSSLECLLTHAYKRHLSLKSKLLCFKIRAHFFSNLSLSMLSNPKLKKTCKSSCGLVSKSVPIWDTLRTKHQSANKSSLQSIHHRALARSHPSVHCVFSCLLYTSPSPRD